MPSQEDINHQLNLLSLHRRALTGALLPQRTSFGASLVPQHIMFGIEENRESIARIKQVLLRWNVPVEDIPNVDYDSPEDTITVEVDRATYDRMCQILAPYGIVLPELD